MALMVGVATSQSLLLGTSGDVKELEGKGDNLDQSSRVQAVVDFYGRPISRRWAARATSRIHPNRNWSATVVWENSAACVI